MAKPNLIRSSNFSTADQKKMILKQLLSGEHPVEYKGIQFRDYIYGGLQSDDLGYFVKDAETPVGDIKGIPLDFDYIFPLDSIFDFIYTAISTHSFHRLFKISSSEDGTYIEDIFFNKKLQFNTVHASGEDITIDSRVFSVFGLNKKTLRKNDYIFINSKIVLIESSRKGESILFKFKQK